MQFKERAASSTSCKEAIKAAELACKEKRELAVEASRLAMVAATSRHNEDMEDGETVVVSDGDTECMEYESEDGMRASSIASVKSRDSSMESVRGGSISPGDRASLTGSGDQPFKRGRGRPPKTAGDYTSLAQAKINVNKLIDSEPKHRRDISLEDLSATEFQLTREGKTKKV